MGVLVLKHNFS